MRCYREKVTPQRLLQNAFHKHCFFDELEALEGGGRKGSNRVFLNGTMYSQPRRRSWSIVVRELELDADGQPATDGQFTGELFDVMYAYGKRNSRIRTDVMATPMPWEIYQLGVQCFLAVQHHLSEACSLTPPNHCQLLGYYALFDSKVGRHKDDHEISHFHELPLTILNPKYSEEEKQSAIADATMKSKGAMVLGSDVLVYVLALCPFCSRGVTRARATTLSKENCTRPTRTCRCICRTGQCSSSRQSTTFSSTTRSPSTGTRPS